MLISAQAVASSSCVSLDATQLATIA
jgi:hypothetical protein